MTEIDDIFSSKGKTGPPLQPSRVCLKKNKKKKKKQGVSLDPPKKRSPEPTKRPLPETIVDLSAPPNLSKRHRTDSDPNLPSKRRKHAREEVLFKDSRGTGPRRKTEEGWNIYKEDELGLNHLGGDTPLCPFDCECCF